VNMGNVASDFFAGLASLNAWQFVGLILLVAVARGVGPLFVGGNKSVDRSMNKRTGSDG
jgi:hypothetical protein